MEIKLENLTKKFGNVTAVDQLTLNVPSGEFVAFLGPSGCGKTTTLLMIAGIYRPTSGTIRFGDRIVNRTPPRERNIGMVFQSYALYPHMTAYDNMAFPLELKRVRGREQRQRVQTTAEMMGIGQLLDRRPSELSGGQQQRVALGRALVKQPDVLLFDEPLSNLDARLRLVMRAEIKRLHSAVGITSIYVTHDQIEALTIADRIAVMDHGHLVAFDTPDDLYNRPRTKFVAAFVGNPPMNFINVRLMHDDDRLWAMTSDGTFRVALDGAHAARLTEANVRDAILGIRPEDISLSANGQNIQGTIFNVDPLGPQDLIGIRVGENDIFLLGNPHQRRKVDTQAAIEVVQTKLQFFHPQTEMSLL
jgi:inositol-phosphate transport system ATP-binding protein